MTHTHELEDLDLAGLSPSLAVPVKGAASASAPAFERTYLEGRFGPYGVRWQLVFQGLSYLEGRWLDQLHIVVEGWPLCIYFDVTEAIEKRAATPSS